MLYQLSYRPLFALLMQAWKNYYCNAPLCVTRIDSLEVIRGTLFAIPLGSRPSAVKFEV
jgi:hypothetical protein